MKKALALLITAAILLSTMPIAVCGAAPVNGWWTNTSPFDDVTEGSWYYDSVKKCFNNGIVRGMSNGIFSPNGVLTRAQFVTMLAALPESGFSHKVTDCNFEDVKPEHWYYNVICWAKEKGYVAGMTETAFAPNSPVTREQVVRVLFLYINSFNEWEIDKTPRNDLSAFEDADKISDWALEGMQWAVAAGTVSGMTETTIIPDGTATRAQACRMMAVVLDYIYYGGLRQTDGTFRILADHISEISGEPDDNGIYKYTAVTAEQHYEIIYNSKEDILTFKNQTYPMNTAHEVIEYGESCTLTIHGIEDEYTLVYNSSDLLTGIRADITAILTKDGYTLDFFNVSEENKETATKNAETAFAEFLACFSDTLTDCGLTIEKIFA